MARQADKAGDVLRHILALDGVRGTAVGLVLIFHLFWSNTETSSHALNIIGKLRGAGWVGVDLFYTLSGFLITGILFDSLADQHFFKNFYVRRLLRIVPLYYGVATALFLFYWLHSHEAGAARLYWLLIAYLNNTPLWWHSVGGAKFAEATNHLWSLAVEEQFYLVWPFLVFAVRDRRRLLWLALGLAALAPISRALLLAHGAPFDATYKLTICRADSLLGGAWLALAVRGPMRDRILRWAPWGLAAGLLSCVAIAWRTGNFDFEVNRSVNLLGFSLVALAATSWLAMALRPGVAERLMTMGWLRFLGKYSYGLYVLHMPVAIVLSHTLLRWSDARVHSRIASHLVDFSLTMAVLIPVAMLSFALWEQPFLKLKRRFSYARPKGVAFPG